MNKQYKSTTKTSSSVKVYNNKRPKHYITSQIKDGVFEKTMLEVRLKLTKFNIIGSQFIHLKPIDFISNILAEHFFSPYQLIGSGFLAIIGFLSIALVGYKNISVPNSLMVMLWLVGYLGGTVIHLSIKFINKRKS